MGEKNTFLYFFRHCIFVAYYNFSGSPYARARPRSNSSRATVPELGRYLSQLQGLPSVAQPVPGLVVMGDITMTWKWSGGLPFHESLLEIHTGDSQEDVGRN